jgi:BlaI family penicillinase repressor
MKKSLSKPEWALMEALWQKPDLTMSGIIEAMNGAFDWKYNTYVTYVKRMCDKELVGYKRIGRDNFYYPLVEKAQCFMEESRHILDKFSSRSAKDLLVYMIRDSDLSATDREELKALLDDLNKEGEQK